jgi:hypothetical protein
MRTKRTLRARLESLAADLGVKQDISLPGFVANPNAYMIGFERAGEQRQ